MEPPLHVPAEIAKYRVVVEAHLADLLKKTGSSVTVGAYKDAIFRRQDTSGFRSYLKEALEVFDCSDIDSASERVISVIQDAWNYFPINLSRDAVPLKCSPCSTRQMPSSYWFPA
jgi:hypothetical protein